MFKIKSHYRYKTQGELSKNLWSTENQNLKIKLKQNPNVASNKTETETVAKILNQDKIKNQPLLQRIYSNHNSINAIKSERFQPRNGEQINFHFEKQRLRIQNFQQQLCLICKQEFQESKKKQILVKLTSLIKDKIQCQDQLMIKFGKRQPHNDQQLKNIKNLKLSIQKISSQNNKIIGLNKNLTEDIKKQRKLRILFQNYFQHLEKQIKLQKNIYNSLLLKSTENKLFVFMISSSDVISNGHILCFKAQNQTEVQNDLNKNTYMCLPTRNSYLQQVDENMSKQKNQKFLSKKGKMKKLAKILDIMYSSKALQNSELQLYQHEQALQKTRTHIDSCFKSLSHQEKDEFPTKMLKKQSILKKKGLKKSKGRLGKIVSIKLLQGINNYFNENFDQTVLQLFVFYQALGLNMFARQQSHSNQKTEDFFQFDTDELVNRSAKRLELIRVKNQNIQKFNQVLQRKISLIDQNVFQTQCYLDELQKKIKIDSQKHYQQSSESTTEQQKDNKNIYLDITALLGINFQNFNSQKQVSETIEKINSSVTETKQKQKNKQTEISNQNQTENQSSSSSQVSSTCIDISSKHKQKSQDSLVTMMKFSRNDYTRNMNKTEGCLKKFHQLIHNDDGKQSKASRLNQSCRSIFQNGMKSLNNIFNNLKVCNSYQRAFERQQFEKQYSKQITKKKRVMFRRQARVMPTKKQIEGLIQNEP